MQSLKKVFDKLFSVKPAKKIFNVFINPSTIKIFNKVYESSPSFFLEIFVRLFDTQNFDYIWKISLPNKKNAHQLAPCRSETFFKKIITATS
mgnify:CR=1 FL=1